MRSTHARFLATAATLAVMAAGTAAGQSPSAAVTTTTAKAFLAPLPARFLVTPTDPRQCGLPTWLRCPPVLVYGARGTTLPTIEPVIKADLPHVRVSFVLQEIANKVIAGGGINDADTFVHWLTTGAAADVEKGGPYGYTLPPPGITWDEDDLYHTVLYDALVFNACESFAAFPVVHDATIADGGLEIGAFHGADAGTINHTGYYTFSYVVRAQAGNKISDFRFSGKVSATCSGLNALP